MNPNSLANKLAIAAEPWVALDQAISACEEPALWKAVAAFQDREAALQELAIKLPRLAYQHRRTVYLTELLLCPFIVSGLPTRGFNDEDWRVSSFLITEAVNQWFSGTRASVRVMSGFRTYERISSWKPHVLREHLLAAVPGRPRGQVEFTSPLPNLPVGAPRLAFIAILATCKDGWIKLPRVGAEEDLRFRDRIAAAVHHHSPLNPPIALTPMHMHESVGEGLGRWLDELHVTSPVAGWKADLEQRGDDIVRITLQLDDQEVPATWFDVRVHQISPQGLRQLLAKLAALAPRLDKPMDQAN